MNVVYYNQDGQEAKSEQGSLAKAEQHRTKFRYYIKYNVTGVDAPHLINPWSVYGKPNTLSAYSSERGKPVADFKEVSQDVFEFYLRFLRTQNEAHYRQAERLMD